MLGGAPVHDCTGAAFETPGPLTRRNHERIPPKARHGSLERGQRAQRRIEEEEPEDFPGQRLWLRMRLQPAREREQSEHLIALKICKIDKALHGELRFPALLQAPISASATRSRSTCSSS